MSIRFTQARSLHTRSLERSRRPAAGAWDPVTFVGVANTPEAGLLPAARRVLERADVIFADPTLRLAALEGIPSRSPVRSTEPESSFARALRRESRLGLRVVVVTRCSAFLGLPDEKLLSRAMRVGLAPAVVPGMSEIGAAAAFAGLEADATRLAPALLVDARSARPRGRAGSDRAAADPIHRTTIVAIGSRDPSRAAAELLDAGEPPASAVAILAAGEPGRVTSVGALARGRRRPSSAPCRASDRFLVLGPAARAAARSALPDRRPGPLRGRLLVVTRPEADSNELAERLRSLGASVRELPSIRIVPPRDLEPLRRAAREAARYDWIVFTSRNGVERFFAERLRQGLDARSLGKARVAAIGPTTAEALLANGLRADLVPARRFIAEGLLAELARRRAIEGRSFLLPRSALARPALVDGLRKAGAAVVRDVKAYATETPRGGRIAAAVRAESRRGAIDACLLTSASGASGLRSLLGRATGTGRPTPAIAIGPETARAARRAGFRVLGMAREFTEEGLVAEVMRRLAAKRRIPRRSPR